MLAMDWAEDKYPTVLQQFDFVFLVALKNVNKNIPLEEIILYQHGRLRNMGVSKEQIKSFIQTKKVLILFDGYDEYRKGTNTDIDNTITDSLGSCFILVTSRPGDYMKKPDRDQMDEKYRSLDSVMKQLRCVLQNTSKMNKGQRISLQNVENRKLNIYFIYLLCY